MSLLALLPDSFDSNAEIKPPKFSIGDVVSLAGVRHCPEMVVTLISERGKSTCQWFDKSDVLHESTFDDRVLAKVV